MKRIAGIIAAGFLLVFSGCENVFEGIELKDKIDSSIQYNNTESVSLRIGCDPAYGSVSSTNGSNIKIGYPAEIKFIKSSSFDKNYIYEELICVDSRDETTELNDFVSIEYTDSQKLTAKVTVKKYSENLFIKPKVKVIPKVVASIPEEGKKAIPDNSAIRLKFNKSMKKADGSSDLVDSNGILNTEKISMGYGTKVLGPDGYGCFVSEKFTGSYKGEFNSDGTLLTLSRKETVKESSDNSLDFVICINEGTTDGEGCAFNKKFEYQAQFLGQKDLEPPVINELKADVISIEDDNEVVSTVVSEINKNASRDVSSNPPHSNNSIKIKVKASDIVPPSSDYDELNVSKIYVEFINQNEKEGKLINSTDIAGVVHQFKVCFDYQNESGKGKLVETFKREVESEMYLGNSEIQKDGTRLFTIKLNEFYFNLAGYYVVKVYAEDAAGNDSESSSYGEIVFYREPLSPLDKNASNGSDRLKNLARASYVDAMDSKLSLHPSFLQKNNSTKYHPIYAMLFEGEIEKGNDPAGKTPLRSVKLSKDSNSMTEDGSYIFDSLENDKKYTVMYSIPNPDGSYDNLYWVAIVAVPTSSELKSRFCSADISTTTLLEDAYLYATDTAPIFNLPGVKSLNSELLVYGATEVIRTELYIRTVTSNTKSDWKYYTVNNNGEISDYPSAEFCEGVLKFTAKVQADKFSTPADAFWTYSKVFTMERGTVRANAKFNSVGKWYNSDTDDYKYIVLDTYDNYDPSRPSDTWYPPKTIWSRYNSASESTTKDYSACVSWISSNKTSKLGSSYDWRLPTADELNLMWKYKSYIESAASLPSDTSKRIVLIGGTSSSDIWRMYYRRGTSAVTEGVAEKSYNTDGYVVWPVATLPRPVYCLNCGAKYYSQSGIDSCKTKEGCAGWTTPCSVCGRKYHTTSEANVCSFTENCPGFTTPVATYQFHNTIELLPAGTDGSAGTTGKYVLFGDWPQTLRSSDVGIYKSYSITVGRFTYYLASDGNYYAVKNGNYYKVEPVKWRVLTDNYQNTGNALLTAENCLDSVENYSGNPNANNYYIRTIDGRKILTNDWEYSWPRASLNGLPFYRATSDTAYNTDNQYINKGMYHTMFDESGRSLIVLTDVMYDYVDTGVSDYQGRDTKDYLFILSDTELSTGVYGFKTPDNGSRAVTGYETNSGYFIRTQYQSYGIRASDYKYGYSAIGKTCAIVPSMTVNSKAIFGDDYVVKDIVSMEITGVTNITPENNAFKFKVKTTNKAAKITVSYKKTEDSSYATKDLTADADGFYEITGLSDGYIYDVKVKATDASGQESPERSGYKMMTAPAAPAIEEVGAWLDGTIPDGVNEIHWNKDSTRTSDYKYTIQYGRGVKYANPERISEYTDDSLLSFRLYKNSSLVKEFSCDSTNQFEIPLSSGVTPGNYTYSISSVLKVGKNYIEGPKRTFTFHETCCDLAYVALLFSYYSSNNEYILVNSCAVYKAAPTVSTPLNIVAWDKNNGSSTGTLSNSGSTSQYSYTSNGYYSYVRTDYCMSPESFFKYMVYSSNSSVTPLYTFTFTQKTAPQSDTTYEIKKSEVNLQFVW